MILNVNKTSILTLIIISSTRQQRLRWACNIDRALQVYLTSYDYKNQK